MKSLPVLFIIFVVAFLGGWVGQAGLIPYPGINYTQMRLEQMERKVAALETDVETLVAGQQAFETSIREAAEAAATDRWELTRIQEKRAALAARAVLPAQELTSVDGRKINVSIREIFADSVRVRRSDGEEFRIPLDQLIEEDREFIDYLRENQPDLRPEPEPEDNEESETLTNEALESLFN